MKRLEGEQIKVSQGIQMRLGKLVTQQSIFEDDVLGPEWDHLSYQPMQAEPHKYRRPHVELFSEADVAAFEKGRLSSCDHDTQTMYKSIVARLKDAGNIRALKTMPTDWVERLDDLDARFPNMAEVINDTFRSHMQLAELGDRRLALPPLLLVGPPGVGKTEVINEFAQLFDIDALPISLNSAQTGAQLTGTDAHYANTATGQLFSMVAYGRYANPIVILDEIDKCQSNADRNRPNPAASLLELLEKRTAAQFRDLCIREIPIDVSNVLWIALANAVDDIDAPLLSRFTVIHVPAPNKQQSIEIGNSIFKKMVTTEPWGSAFAATRLPAAVADRIAGMSPRQMKKAIFRGLAAAARDHRRELQASDIAEDLRGEQRRPIGFTQ